MRPSLKRPLLTLFRRELQEYRVSLLITPLLIALVLSLMMLVSVLVADRITVMGDTFMKVISSQHALVEPVISIQIEEGGSPGTVPEGAPAPGVRDFQVVIEADSAHPAEEWDFSREWRFETGKPDTPEYETREVGGLNPILEVMHSFMLVILVLVTANYLLGCLYNDRKDRTILFWKSMPVSEWEEVLVRFAVALAVTPIIFIVISLIMQVVFVLLAMLLVWRLDMDPFSAVLGNLDLPILLVRQLVGWWLTALWIAPLYGWLMLASALARRSPFLLAIAPVVGLVVVESIMFGTSYVLSALVNHIPHYVGGQSGAGFSLEASYWSQVDYSGLAGGLVLAAATIAGSVYLRRYRFEIG